MQKLYKMRNAKVGDKGVAKVVDTFSFSVGIRRGWPRAISLHWLLGYNYLKPLLTLSPTDFSPFVAWIQLPETAPDVITHGPLAGLGY